MVTKRKKINSRQKGASSEREFANRIQKNLGIKLVRNLSQARSGGADLVVDENVVGPLADIFRKLAIECKRYSQVKPGNIENWWKQVQRESKEIKGCPVLCYRADFQDWKVVVPVCWLNTVCKDGDWWDVGLSETATISPEVFCDFVLLELISHK